MRDAGNFAPLVEWERVKKQIDKSGSGFTLFGGEALLTPMKHLEEVFAYGLEKFGQNGIQTNGLLINEDHIGIFKKYKVHVGVSVDGVGEMNEPRCSAEDTKKIITNISRLCSEGIIPSLILTVHRKSAQLSKMMAFMHFLGKYGVKSFNFHILETDNEKVRQKLQLTNMENFDFYKGIYDFCKSEKFHVNPFADIKALLTQEAPNVSCIWGACDPLQTAAVQGIKGDGELANCGRTNKDGVDWAKTTGTSKERYVALYRTPQEFGGCKDCRYFFACKGQCPGTAIDGDWRNKTVHCSFWYNLMQYIEHDLRKSGEQVLSHPVMEEKGKNIGKQYMPSHGHADTPHMDVPHTDWHNDHSDTPVYNLAELYNDTKTRL